MFTGTRVKLKDITRQVHQLVALHDNIVAVYLFGSTATGKMRQSSDVDIAIMSRYPVGGFERVDLETEFSLFLDRDVDLVVFHQAEALLQHQILKYGTLLYENDLSERVRQETMARREYLDTRFLFRELVT